MPLLDSATGLKTCTKCGIPKVAEDFRSDLKHSDGLRSSCRECGRLAERGKYKRNPEKFRAQRKKYYGRNFVRILANDKEYNKRNPERYLITLARSRAKKAGIPCTIVEADIHIPDICPIASCGRKLLRGEKIFTPSSPSLDKYDPRLGYVPGNVWVICLECNRRKQSMSGEDHVVFGWELIEAFKRVGEITVWPITSAAGSGNGNTGSVLCAR